MQLEYCKVQIWEQNHCKACPFASKSESNMFWRNEIIYPELKQVCNERCTEVLEIRDTLWSSTAIIRIVINIIVIPVIGKTLQGMKMNVLGWNSYMWPWVLLSTHLCAQLARLDVQWEPISYSNPQQTATHKYIPAKQRATNLKEDGHRLDTWCTPQVA